MLKPSKLRLEASSHCQLRCPSCPTTTGHIDPAVGRGLLSLADFRSLIDDNPWIEEIELSNYGEIFINPALPQILEYAHQHDVRLSAANGVNLNSASDAALESLVKYSLRHLTVSIDGANDDTYAKYRLRGRFETVIANIRKINRYKEMYSSVFPKMDWQFIAFGHNQHEIVRAKEMAGELGMAFRLKLTWDDGFSPVEDAQALRRENPCGVASRREYTEKYNVDYMQAICHQLWDQPQINWNGDLLGCCRNFWGSFGANVFRDGLLESLNSERIVYAREMLLGRKPARRDIPCDKCEIYQGMKAGRRRLERPAE